jgi:hypothetical protein
VVATDSASLLEEHKKLTGQIAQLTQAVRGLIQLQAIANQKLDSAIKGNAECAVL